MTRILVPVSDVASALICSETLAIPSDYEDSDDEKMTVDLVVETNSTPNDAAGSYARTPPPTSAARREYMPGVFQSVSLFSELFGGLSPEDREVDPPVCTVGKSSRSFRRRRDEDTRPSSISMSRTAHSGRPLYDHDLWVARFHELCSFRARYGHCMVPRTWSENKALANFVKKCRREYRMAMEGKCFTMTPERIAMLDSINFEWSRSSESDSDFDRSRKFSRVQGQWNGYFSMLFHFKSRFGHCRVPEGWKENPRLAQWVTDQRREYALHLSKQRTTMTKERFQRLDALGFLWRESDRDDKLYPVQAIIPKHGLVTPSLSLAASPSSTASSGQPYFGHSLNWKETGGNPIPNAAVKHKATTASRRTPGAAYAMFYDNEAFNLKFKELQAHQKVRGHSTVTNEDSPSLYYWVKILRDINKGIYRQPANWKAQKRKLNSIGFVWSLDSPPGESTTFASSSSGSSKSTTNALSDADKQWNLMYDNLCQFKSEHGHCNGFSTQEPIGRWVYRQRYEYRLLLSGQASPFTVKKKRKLDRYVAQSSLG